MSRDALRVVTPHEVVDSEGPEEVDDDVLDDLYFIAWDRKQARDWAGFEADMRAVDVATARVSVLLSHLIVTAWPEVRPHMTTRDGFFDRVRERLVREQGERMADILLEGMG